MKKLVLKPEMIETFARRANEFTSQTLGKLREDLERVRQQLAAVRTKIGHYVDAIGEGGKAALASVKDRLQTLEAEREELEASEARLKAEYEAEGAQEIVAQDQVRTLQLFEQLVKRNEDRPDRLKSLIPRFIDYVVWRTKDKGEGDFEVSLYPNPVALAPDAVLGEGPAGPGNSELKAVGSSETNSWYRTPQGKSYNNPMICRMLRSLTYVGKLQYEGQVHDAQWEPIRSRDIHEKIQKLMDRNARLNGTPNRPTREYAYLLQGLIRCGSCGHRMSPQPGTSRTGRLHPYYSCGFAEKSRGTSCPFRYVPAQSADQAVLEFLKQLHLKPELVKAFAERANEFASETLAKLRADLERVKEPLSVVRTKIANMVEAVALGGKAVMASLKDKLEALEVEKAELETTEARLKAEIQAEQTQEISVQDQIQTLSLFEQLVSENEDKPERLKNLLPRFIDYIVWHSREKGEGEIEVALFPNVVALAPEVTYVGEPVRDGEFGPGGPLVRWSPSDGIPPDGRHEPSDAPRPRALPVLARYYTRTRKRHRRFVLGDKPAELKDFDSIDERVWEQYENYAKRITPLERAEFYRRLMDEKRLKSMCALARAVGKDEAAVRKYMGLLKLPEPIQAFLRDHRTPAYVRYFSEKRLREILKLRDPRAAWRRFQEMVAEAHREASRLCTQPKGDRSVSPP